MRQLARLGSQQLLASRAAMAAVVGHVGSADRAAGHRKGEIPALDGVRGVAILLVLWCHLSGIRLSGTWYVLQLGKDFGGFLGVYLFFVLSGFLLFLPYARALTNPIAWPSARRFYQRRVLRIVPVYYAALLFPVGTTLVGAVMAGGLASLKAALHPVGPVLLLLHDLRPDAWQFILSVNTPLWSLAVEWQFYLLLPVLALGLRRLGRRFGTAGVTAGLCGLMGYGLVVRAVAASTFYLWHYPNVIQAPGVASFILALLYGMYGKYLELFSLGMVLSLSYVVVTAPRHTSSHANDAANHARTPAHARRLAVLALVATLVAVLVGLPANLAFSHWAGLIPIPPQAYVGRWPQEASGAWIWSVAGPWLQGICALGLITGAVLGPTWLRRAWAWTPLRRVGTISYSLYVWHAVMQHFFIAHWGAHAINWRIVVYVASLFALCTLSYWVIERPFLLARRRRGEALQRPHLHTATLRPAGAGEDNG